ncbi:hypothetical protein GMST_16530 [Geomonas silvestris]|uniref:Capsule assembly protein Wzi n=1 Tax=Geomonas silvestris TaxID=2740184 RepID=A0A6V8MH76_9BACT|nr:capsule assembly Wzi family protein [Geomonas silvestris]GFO59328.1 hypothetical protein GMST_16530 [Geomonas silvestris]
MISIRCVLLIVVAFLAFTGRAFALSSPNVPLDSPIYLYLEKLSGYGLITSDFRGIRPFSRSEAARLLKEAEANLPSGAYPELAGELVLRLRELLPRESDLYGHEEKAPRFDTAIGTAKLRYVYLDGQPRSYYRAVNDPGNDGAFGIGSGLRPPNPYPAPIQQRGSEGTPLFENNEGVVYRSGSNLDLRASGEAYLGAQTALFVEPMLLWSEKDDDTRLRLNKGYLKLGGKGLELELGRDENWLGPGYRGTLTLTNNAKNFDEVKLSSPEPVQTRYLWDLKYDLIFSRFEKTTTGTATRQPFFIAFKLSMKPTENFEFGINLGRQAGGPGVPNGPADTLRGLVGGTSSDNSNSVAGIDLRYRIPWLRNAELYGEYSGEDSAAFWPIVESYLAGFYIPRLSASGKDDLRFEYLRGNQILYTNSTFPEGYLHYNLPIGHSQGGGAQEFFLRYSHWFSPRNNLALEAFRTSRGDYGRITVDPSGSFDPNGVMQAIERKYAVRGFWTFPVKGELSALVMYGREWIDNFELRSGVFRSNQLVRAEMRYRY